MADVQRTYVPAAGHDWTLPFYDPLVKALGGDSARRVLVDQAELQPGHRVLEVGCGTGTLLTLIARAQPGIAVTGLDPDARALARAARKAEAASLAIRLDRGFSDALPYPEASFDRVFSCFMFHHLENADDKHRTLREIRRVLKPGGRLQLLDFLRPHTQKAGVLARWLHSNHRLADNTEARMLSFMETAGFDKPAIVGRGKMFVTFNLAYYQAVAPRR